MLPPQNSSISFSPWTMEGGLPMLNCLVQHTEKPMYFFRFFQFFKVGICSLLENTPRNYPPPKWDHGGGILDRAKGNKRNWILVWEDGFCDFCECERTDCGYVKGRFGADVFFKMSHEVYSFGEGLVGKVAAENSHKWVFRDAENEKDTAFISSWNVSLDPQPRAWEAQFKSGIQTIAIVSVREGIIQLGSFDKAAEDLDLVISIQRKFSYLQSIPGIYAIQRPCLPIQHPYSFKSNNHHLSIETNEADYEIDDKYQLIGSKRLYCELPDNSLMKSINLGYNTSQDSVSGSPYLWSIPPLLPSKAQGPAALLTKMPSVSPSDEALDTILLNNQSNSLSDKLKCKG